MDRESTMQYPPLPDMWATQQRIERPSRAREVRNETKRDAARLVVVVNHLDGDLPPSPLLFFNPSPLSPRVPPRPRGAQSLRGARGRAEYSRESRRPTWPTRSLQRLITRGRGRSMMEQEDARRKMAAAAGERGQVVVLECVAGSSKAEEWGGGGGVVQEGDVVEAVGWGAAAARPRRRGAGGAVQGARRAAQGDARRVQARGHLRRGARPRRQRAAGLHPPSLRRRRRRRWRRRRRRRRRRWEEAVRAAFPARPQLRSWLRRPPRKRVPLVAR